MLALMTDPDRPGSLMVAEVDEPTPEPDQAVVQVATASLNRGELKLVASRPDRWRPGQDVAGTIAVAAGDGTGPDVGTPVVAWADQGGWAERVAVSTNRIAVLGAGVDLAAAATLPVAGVTALRLIRRGAPLLGRRVLVTGATGGVGRFAVELAAVSGAEVTGVASDPTKASDLLEIGADELVPTPSEATGRFRLLLESVGGASLEAMPSLMDRDGVLVLFGNSSGEPSRLSFPDLRGSPDGRIEVLRVYESRDTRSEYDDLRQLADLLSRGRLHPRIGLEVPFREADRALSALADRQVMGKAVLRFG